MDQYHENKKMIKKLFDHIEQNQDWAPFIAALDDNLTWIVTGTSPISGVYKSKQAWQEKVCEPIFNLMSGPVDCHLNKIVAEKNCVIVLWRGKAMSKLGISYEQEYCWVLEVTDKKITKVTGFYDSFLVTSLFMLHGKVKI